MADRHATDGLLKAGEKHLFALAAIEFEQQRLYGAYSGGRQRQRPVTKDGQRQCADWLRSELAAQRDRLVMLLCLVGDVLESAQDRRREWVESIRYAWIAAIGGVQKLH